MAFRDRQGDSTYHERELRIGPDVQFLKEVYGRRAEKAGDRPTTHDFDQLPRLKARPGESASELSERKQRTRDRHQLLADKVREEHANWSTPEGVLMEQFLLSEVSGSDLFEGASTFQTTDYDDRINGVDLVLEWESEGNPITIAVDVASGQYDKNLKEKVKRHQAGARVDYFESDLQDNENGEPLQQSLKEIPFIVLGFDSDHLKDIAKHAKEHRTSRTVKDARGNSKSVSGIKRGAFQDHPVKLLLLEEANMQMEQNLRYLIATIVDNLLNNRELATMHETLRTLRGYVDTDRIDSLLQLFDRNREGADLQREIIGEASWGKLQSWIDAYSKVNEVRNAANKKASPSVQRRAEIWKRRTALYRVLSEESGSSI